ncbi:MAG TPA: hypothetical protein VKI64_09740, partial [Acidimicrobiales bacterium]|nr:hypothetical protein [Acidimicrobiales bacterium]
HILGFLGMPRRVYTYSAGLGWDGLNLLASIGGFLFGLGTALTLVNVVWSRVKGEPAPANPWDADSLEWSTTSPPPHWNFDRIPVVTSRHPLWDQPELAYAASGSDPATRAYGLPGALDRQTPISTGLDAAPEETMEIPRDTYLPLVFALGTAVIFTGLLAKAIAVGAVGVALAVVALVRWAWRTEEDLK